MKEILVIAVPRSQPKLSVEHSHAIDHVVEGDPQFRLTLAQFVEQPRVFHRDHGLRGEVLEQRDLLVSEWAHFLPIKGKNAQEGAVLDERDHEYRTHPAKLDSCFRYRIFRDRRSNFREIGDVNEW